MKLINNIIAKLKSDKPVSRDERNTIIHIITEYFTQDEFKDGLMIVQMSPEIYANYLSHFYETNEYKKQITMPRNISFFLTTNQVKNKRKDVTRRIGWDFLKADDNLNACVKCQGLKKGEKIDKICQIKVVSVKRETLRNITQKECAREGFPNMTPGEFVGMFCKSHTGCTPDSVINRIEFEYI